MYFWPLSPFYFFRASSGIYYRNQSGSSEIVNNELKYSLEMEGNEQSFFIGSTKFYRFLRDWSVFVEQHIGLFCCQGLNPNVVPVFDSRNVFRVNVASSDFAKISPYNGTFPQTRRFFSEIEEQLFFFNKQCDVKKRQDLLKKGFCITTVFCFNLQSSSFFLHYLFIRDPASAFNFMFFTFFTNFGWHLTFGSPRKCW